MKLSKLALTLGAVSLLFASSALALGPVSIGVNADYASRYVWRGFDIYSNGDAFQPSASAAYSPIEPLEISFGIWGSYDVDGMKEWTEIDYTLAASYAINDMFSVSAGYIFYAFPNVAGSDENDTKEIFAGVDAALPMGFSAGLAGYYDHDDGKGYYLSASIGYDYALSETASASLGVSAGYMDYDDDGVYAGFDGLSDVNFKGSLSADLGHDLSLSVTAAYTIADDDINEDNEFWTLSSIGYSF